MEAKVAELERLQAEGKPVDPSLEENLAQYQELARQEQERQQRENETFFKRAEERDEDDSYSYYDPWAPCRNTPGG